MILSLLSKDYIKLRDVKGRKYEEHILKFPLIDNYDEYYEQYIIETEAIDSDLKPEQQMQEKRNIVERIASSIARTQNVEWIEVEVLVKSISITHKEVTNTFILIKQNVDELSYFDEN